MRKIELYIDNIKEPFETDKQYKKRIKKEGLYLKIEEIFI